MNQRWIYFIAAGDYREDGCPIKIGIAKNPPRRVKELQTGSPETLVLVDMFLPWEDEDVDQFERLLHKHHEGSRLQGEWFRSTPPLRALIYDLRHEWGSTWHELGAHS